MHMYIIRRRGVTPSTTGLVILRSPCPAILHSLYPAILHPPRPAPSCARFPSLRGLSPAPKSAASALVQRNLYTVVLLSAWNLELFFAFAAATFCARWPSALPSHEATGCSLPRCGESDFLSIGGIPKIVSHAWIWWCLRVPETRPRRLTMFLRVRLSPAKETSSSVRFLYWGLFLSCRLHVECVRARDIPRAGPSCQEKDRSFKPVGESGLRTHQNSCCIHEEMPIPPVKTSAAAATARRPPAG